IQCENAQQGCSNNPCRLGTCTNLPNGAYFCTCPPSTTGYNCNIVVMPCDLRPCLNNGTCISVSATNYTCICPTSFTGLICQQQIFTCPINNCVGNSTCIADQSGQRCVCPPGRYGTNCEQVSMCYSNPCVYGTCRVSGVNTFQCVCNPGFGGATCEVPIDVCGSSPCLNAGTCINLGNGLFQCTCLPQFTGIDCGQPLCVPGSCVNGATCSIAGNVLQCQCLCGYTGRRCETPIDICSIVLCQNQATSIINSTICQCFCACPSSFTGTLCQTPVSPMNRTYTGQLSVPLTRPGGSSWASIVDCIDQVWNTVNTLLASLIRQAEALQECGAQNSQLVWFQSAGELTQQLVPAIFARGLARDFWTSGLFDSTLNRWQWLLSDNNTRIDIDPTLLAQFNIDSRTGQSLRVTFSQAPAVRLVATSASETYVTVCKLAANRIFLNNLTRVIDLTSQQSGFSNQYVIIYRFNYTIFPNVPSTVSIQQPTLANYAELCGTVSGPSSPVSPYTIDICDYF
ncbi:unnamed protein product, partial [Didymodactylos carnosus]